MVDKKSAIEVHRPVQQRKSGWLLREPPWLIDKLVVGILLSILFFTLQLVFDNQRDEESRRLENVRFIRERSDILFRPRPFAAMDLRGMNISSLSLDGASFVGADLEGSNMIFIQLGEVEESEKPEELRNNPNSLPPIAMGGNGRYSPGAIPGNSLLMGANLCGAKLNGADLAKADLQFANLSHADLTDAVMQGVDISHANLTGASLDASQLVDIFYDDTTIWPYPGFAKPPRQPEDPGLDRISDQLISAYVKDGTPPCHQ